MAAARPGPSAGDARVPCPLCGGLIHPIAGKCKHCKAELAAYRAVGPAANSPLPALHYAAPSAANGQSVSGPVAHAVQLPPAAQTVLPPRHGSRAQHPSSSPRPMWRSWPVVVIVLAMMAIVAAVVLMVWPASRPRDGKHVLQPPPAPERMDTQTPPVEPHPAPAPHAAAPSAPEATTPDQAPAAPADPRPADPNASGQSAQAGSAQPDTGATADADTAADDDSFDPFGGAQGGPTRGRRALGFNSNSMLGFAMVSRLCRKLAQCGTSDPTIRSMCVAMRSQPYSPPSNCPAADRCLRHIDAFGCTSQPDALQVWTMLMQFHDCIDATRC